MKKVIILVTAFCFTMVGFSQRVMAGPAPLSAQESAQLMALDSNAGLLTLKAGGALPDAPVALAATEEAALGNLSAGSRNLENLKAGDDTIVIGTGTAVLILILIVLLVR